MPLLVPRRIAIIGASSREGSVGNLLVKAVQSGGFKGPIFPVHPTERTISGLTAYASIDAVPSAPDVAIIAVPSQYVLEVVNECIRAKVGGLIVISAGFGETGEIGRALENQLADLVRGNGIRMIGPNCVGIINPYAAFDCVFAQHNATMGGTAILTQSGAVGIGLLNLASAKNLGIASFVSLGNKPDVSSNDLLLTWMEDPNIKQVAMYLESFGNPRNFVEIARKFSRTKPLLIVKAGRSSAGSRAAASHTGALADSDRTVDALLRQCGVLRFASVQEMFNAAISFDNGRLPTGPRVAIVTNSGGPAIMAIDLLPELGLEVATLTDETRLALQAILPAAAATSNPVDTLAGADAQTFAKAAELVASDAGVDALLLIHTSVRDDSKAITNIIDELTTKIAEIPILAVRYGQIETIQKRPRGTPTFAFPEDAVKALSSLHKWVVIRDEPAREVQRTSGKLIMPTKQGWLSQSKALEILEKIGLPIVPNAAVASIQDAIVAANAIGFPIAIKGESEHIHKTEHGLVHLNIQNQEQLQANWISLEGLGVDQAIVMKHAPPGLELILGGVQDPRYGPLVAVGLGGTSAEAMGDVQFRLAPLDARDAESMLDDMQSKALLGPWRGQPARDRKKLIEALVAVGDLMFDNPSIEELDINPFIL